MKNVYYGLDWPTFCGVEDGKVMIIPVAILMDIDEEDTITFSHLGKKIVKKVKKIIQRAPKDLTKFEIKQTGFNNYEELSYYLKEKFDSAYVKFVVIENRSNCYYVNTTTNSCYNPEYDEKPWRD